MQRTKVDILIWPRTSWRYAFFVFINTVLLVSIGLGVDATAQTKPENADSAIMDLVERLAQPLKKENAKKIIVFDLRGPNEQLHPAGEWLADKVSMNLRKALPKIETIYRSQLGLGEKIGSTDMHAILIAEISEARSLGADTIISGSFARVSDQIGVSLSIARMSDLDKTQEVRTGLVPISKEITDLASEPIPGLDLKDGIPRAGAGGITMPICTHCPPPEFSGNAAQGGVVRLELIVTIDGRPERITIINTPSPELAASAVRTVQSWRFKPAIGFDGNPIAVFTPIQVTFQ